MRSKKITVKVDESTYRWLTALAKANNPNELYPEPVDAGKLLTQAAFCMADYAGRREGSWEADVARQLLIASGYQKQVSYQVQGQLLRWEDKRNARWAAAVKSSAITLVAGLLLIVGLQAVSGCCSASKSGSNSVSEGRYLNFFYHDSGPDRSADYGGEL